LLTAPIVDASAPGIMIKWLSQLRNLEKSDISQ